MRALVLIGALFGAGYTASIWLAIEHVSGHGSAWNLLVLPVGLGSIASVGLIAWTLLDAVIGGLDD